MIVDLEANGLLYEADKIWCIAVKTGDDVICSRNIERMLEVISDLPYAVFHNGFGYDIPLIKKLYPQWEPPKAHDTQVLSQLYEPDKRGGHSIENWARQFGMIKHPDCDWSQFSPEMIERCKEDVRITEKVFHFLESRMDIEDAPVKLEYRIAELHAQQVLNGVLFDRDKAESLVEQITKEIEDIDKKVIPRIPKRIVQVGTDVKKIFKKDGAYTSQIADWYYNSGAFAAGFDLEDICGPFTRIRYEEINLGSSEQVKGYLLSVGWRPTEWNYKKDKRGRVVYENGSPVRTSPKLSEDSFSSVEGDIPNLVSRRSVLVHRRSMLINENRGTGWLNKIRDDGRIPADGMPLGTPTGRYTHSVIVNVPKNDPDVILGKEFRSLFIVPDGKIMVGTDADSLEARIEGHYTYPYDGGAYARELLEGDTHQINADLWGVSRSKAKNGKYALTYGAQPAKLAETIGKPKRQGKMLYDAFWKNKRALKKLTDDATRLWKRRGYLLGLDGRKLYPRSEHSVINYLFQSGGSIVVKTATCYMNNGFRRAGIDIKQIMHFHDEIQFEAYEKDLPVIEKIIKSSWKKAGEYFNLNIPITGDISVGKNWSETH